MKKLFLIALVCIPFFAKAQVGVSVGPEVGFSFPTFTGVTNPQLGFNGLDILYVGVAFHVGGTAHVQIGDWFGIRPSIYFKSSALTEGFENIYFNDIEIPVDILFSRQTRSGMKIFFGAGPNITYTLSGSVDDSFGGPRQDLNFGSSTTDDLKPLALGVNGKAGMQFGFGFGFNLYFNAGLGNRSTAPEIVRFRNADLFGINLSYLFGGKGNGGSRGGRF